LTTAIATLRNEHHRKPRIKHLPLETYSRDTHSSAVLLLGTGSASNQDTPDYQLHLFITSQISGTRNVGAALELRHCRQCDIFEKQQKPSRARCKTTVLKLEPLPLLKQA